jgi:hypothetical protein
VTTIQVPFEGGCTCKQIRYRVRAQPVIVHCCHCRWCQRETGTAFALNALVETAQVELLAGTPEPVHTPSASGKGQKILRCPTCHVSVWSHYPQAGDLLAFIRIGTLDEPDHHPPDVHIFTMSKQPWVQLPADASAHHEFYDPKTTWSADAMRRMMALRAPATAT